MNIKYRVGLLSNNALPTALLRQIPHSCSIYRRTCSASPTADQHPPQRIAIQKTGTLRSRRCTQRMQLAATVTCTIPSTRTAPRSIASEVREGRLLYVQPRRSNSSVKPRLHHCGPMVKDGYELGYMAGGPGVALRVYEYEVCVSAQGDPARYCLLRVFAYRQILNHSTPSPPRADTSLTLGLRMSVNTLLQERRSFMELTRNVSNSSPCGGLNATVITPLRNGIPVAGLDWKAKAATAAPLVSQPSGSRCLEKGCVFPAAYEGRCLHHERQAREPIFFSSYQPSRVLVERGKFGLPDGEIDTSRSEDRQRLAALRQSFLES
jgi:hypothetical protein